MIRRLLIVIAISMSGVALAQTSPDPAPPTEDQADPAPATPADTDPPAPDAGVDPMPADPVADPLADPVTGTAPTPASPASTTPVPQPQPQPTNPAVIPDAAPGRVSLLDASVSIRSFTPDETREQVNALVASHNGFVQSSDGEHFSYRVPSDRFELFIEGLREIGEVVDERVNSEDVTLELATLRARITETDRSRVRVVGLLTGSDTVNDSLAIEEEMRNVTAELETFQGRLRYLATRMELVPVEVWVSMKARPRVENPRKNRPFPWVESYGLDTLLD